jgi:AcrR family transcriptional regulator
MDLRIVKTKKIIKETFLQLRSKNSLEQIRITELCEIAAINKTTFYKHYQDIYALSDEIENETITSIMDNFQHFDSLFSNTYDFIEGLINAFSLHKKIILTLFSDRMSVLIEKVEAHLKKHYITENHSQESEIALLFLIRGGAQIILNPKYDEAILLKTISNIFEQVIKLI